MSDAEMVAQAICDACWCRLEASVTDVGRTFPCPYCHSPMTVERCADERDKPVDTVVLADDARAGTAECRDRPRVFVSHSTKDREFVEQEIVQFLGTRQIDTWYSRDDIQLADHWQRKILEGLKSCDWFLLVMSQNSAKSEHVMDELHWAIEERQGRIIPVVIEDCNPLDFHMRMTRIQSVDFRQCHDEARNTLAELLAS